jgi:Secretion system C-terminal sorting domain
MSRNISLLLVIFLVTGIAQVWQEVRITNNSTSDDLTSSNNAWCIQANRTWSTVHIVYYTDSITNGEYYNIFYKKLNYDNGSFIGWDTISSPADESNSETPSIAFYRDQYPANLSVLWSEENDDYRIMYRRSTNDGYSWRSRIERVSNETYDYTNPSNNAGPDDDTRYFRFHYVWVSQVDGDEGVYYEWDSHSLTSGEIDQSETDTRLDFSPDAELPSVAASGNFVYVVCQDLVPGEGFQVYLQRNTNYGGSNDWESVQRISEPQSSQMGIAKNACVSANSPYVYVVWQQYICVQQTPTPIYIPVIYLRRSTDNGATWETPIQLTYGGTSPPRGNQVPVYIFEYTPSISVYGSNVCAVWQWGIGSISGAGRYYIVVARSSDNGRTWSEDQKQIVGGYFPGGTDPWMNPSVSAERDVLHIVWTDLRYGFVNPEVYYRKMAWRATDGGGQDISSEIGSFDPLSFKPNPIKNNVKIAFSLPASTQVNLTIYDINGRIVATLIKKELTIGAHQIVWNLEDNNNNKVKNGIYFVRLEAGAFSSNEKLIVAE